LARVCSPELGTTRSLIVAEASASIQVFAVSRFYVMSDAATDASGARTSPERPFDAGSPHHSGRTRGHTVCSFMKWPLRPSTTSEACPATANTGSASWSVADSPLSAAPAHVEKRSSNYRVTVHTVTARRRSSTIITRAALPNPRGHPADLSTAILRSSRQVAHRSRHALTLGDFLAHARRFHCELSEISS
jgi:hypothetical protein